MSWKTRKDGSGRRFQPGSKGIDSKTFDRLKEKDTSRPSKIGAPYVDDQGVRISKVKGIGGIDSDLADIILALNEKGYPTMQSCSGTKGDHPGNPSDYMAGYISFVKAENPNGVEAIRQAAIKAGLTAEDGEVFFMPDICIRLPVAKDGTGRKELIDTANARTNKEVGDWHHMPSRVDGKDFFLKIWLPLRDKYHDQVIKEHGGELHLSDKEIRRRWKLFVKLLPKITSNPTV